jgi:hypothetical protein
MKAMPGPVPTVAVVNMPTPLPRGRKYGEIVTGRVAVQTVVHPMTDPVRPGDFWRVGRDTQHANPHRWLFEGWNDAEILSIQAPNFLFPMIPSAMVIPGSPQPGQRPMAESVVIQAPSVGSWSAMATVRPPLSSNDKYLKLIPR